MFYIFAMSDCTTREWANIMDNYIPDGRFVRSDDPEFLELLQEQVANPDAKIGIVAHCNSIDDDGNENESISTIEELDWVQLTPDGKNLWSVGNKQYHCNFHPFAEYTCFYLCFKLK